MKTIRQHLPIYNTFIRLKYLLVPVLIFTAYGTMIIRAQPDTTIYQAEDVLDDLLQDVQEGVEESELFEVLEDLMINPVDLNTAGLIELQRIPYIDYSRAELIVNHRKKYGDFFSVNELYSVEFLPNDIVPKIIPFITITKMLKDEFLETQTHDIWDGFSNIPGIKMRNRVTTDLQTKKGFTNNNFEGSKYKIYNRILLKGNGKYQLGILTEKDAGEKPIDEFDSYHLLINDTGPVENIILGDYLIEAGQGLVLWSPYGFSKGSDAVYPVKKIPKVIKAYTSATENNFFRGAALRLNWQNFSLSPFFSKNKLDASIADGYIVSTPIDGLHRTIGELSRRKTASETAYGTQLKFKADSKNQVSLLYYHSSFSKPFLAGEVFDPSGSDFDFYSVSYDLYFGDLNISGEAAYNSISLATINNFQFIFSRNFIFITSIRNYPRNYYSLHGIAFSERSNSIQNEIGIYNGFRWKTPIGIVNFYFDQFKFPYAVHNTPLPTQGNEVLTDLSSAPFKSVETRLRYKYENKEVAFNDGASRKIINRLKQSGRTEVIFNVTRQLRLKTRVEYNNYLLKDVNIREEGLLVFEELKLAIPGIADFSARIIFFKTDSFSSAVYEYENDLTGVMSNLAMYGEGLRWYIVARIKPLKLFTLSIKYSETYKPKEKKLSSGNSEIDGNLDNRLSVQLDMNL